MIKGVVTISTLFFYILGINNWKILAIIWAIIPLYNAYVFTKVPMASLLPEGEPSLQIKDLFKMKIFWILLIMMICAGASEQAVIQWASTFAEQGLGLTKAVGDLAGPMTFATMMGISLIPIPKVSLISCAVCGLSVGIMWPGTFSKASAILPKGGTAMFALLALGGDVGCSFGPTLVGMISSSQNDNLKIGILVAIIFPIVLLLGIILCKKSKYSVENIIR